MGGCVSNENDIIEVRINYTRAKLNRNKTQKQKSLPVTTYKFNNIKDFKKSQKTLKTFCFNDISGIMRIPDNEDNASINGDTTFKKIIEVL